MEVTFVSLIDDSVITDYVELAVPSKSSARLTIERYRMLFTAMGKRGLLKGIRNLLISKEQRILAS